MIPREVYVQGIGRGYVRPLEYGDTIRYGEASRTPRLLADLFSRCVIGLDVDAADVERMHPWVPPLLERAICEASDLDTTGDDPSPDPTGDAGHEFREDSVFADPDDADDEITLADQMHWLHEKGYTYQDIYGLLIAEIEQLQEGAERASNNSGSSSGTSSTTSTSVGNRTDRAAQMGWRS